MPAGLDDYFPFIFSDTDGLVAVFAGYFDESIRSDGEEPICVAGFLFKPSGYKAFRRRWNKDVLWFRGRRFAHFHMTDLCAGHGEYSGLGIPERLIILNNAIDAIVSHTYSGIGIYFNQAEFERKAPADWPNHFGSIYSTACQMCIQATAYWLGQDGSQMDVLYVFERGHRFEDETHRLLSALAQSDEARKRLRYRQHMFESKTDVGLQAADFFAWITTKASVANGVVPRAFAPFVTPARRWADEHNDKCRILEFTGEKLDRFINEQMSREPSVRTYTGQHKRAFR